MYGIIVNIPNLFYKGTIQTWKVCHFLQRLLEILPNFFMIVLWKPVSAKQAH